MKKIVISLVALTLAVFLAAPAMAEFDPYGSVRFGMFWQTLDTKVAGVDTDSDLVMPLGNFSNFGAKFKTGDIGGHVKLALWGAEDHDAVYQELLYGTWDFGGGTLLVGQDHTPYTLVSAQVAPGLYDLENGFIGYGALWDGWGYKPQIRVNMESGFYAALIQPNTSWTVDDIDVGTGFTDGDIDVTLPKICVGYEIKAENLTVNPGIAYNTFSAVSKAASFDESINSYLIYVGGKMDLGAADLQANLHYGTNLGDFGITGLPAAASAQLDSNNKVKDSTCYGGYLQVAFNVDPATICLGYGYTQAEMDSSVGTNLKTDAQNSYFVNAKVPIADTFFVVPEFSYYDNMKDAADNDEGTLMEIGLLFRMDF